MYKLNCKNCKKRKIVKLNNGNIVTCHHFCEDYKKWKEEYARELSEAKEKERLDNASRSYDESIAIKSTYKTMKYSKRSKKRY